MTRRFNLVAPLHPRHVDTPEILQEQQRASNWYRWKCDDRDIHTGTHLTRESDSHPVKLCSWQDLWQLFAFGSLSSHRKFGSRGTTPYFVSCIDSVQGAWQSMRKDVILRMLTVADESLSEATSDVSPVCFLGDRRVSCRFPHHQRRTCIDFLLLNVSVLFSV